MLRVVGLLAAWGLVLAVACTQTPTPTPTPMPTRTLMPTRTPTPTPTPMPSAEFDGLTVSLIGYHWTGNSLYTTWSFFNDRPKRIGFEDYHFTAEDQDGNSMWSRQEGIPFVPALWPGETRQSTIIWEGGPRSIMVTILVSDAWGGRIFVITKGR